MRGKASWLSRQVLLAGLLVSSLAAAALSGQLGQRGFFPLPPLVLPDETDRRVSLDDFRGKVVLVNFWATWCPPCVEEFPSMQELKAAFGGELEILAVNVGEEPDQVFSFTGLLDDDINFPVLYDRELEVADAWGIRGLPTSVVVDPHGRGVYRVIGARQWDAPGVIGKLRELLN